MMEADSVHSTLEKIFKPPIYSPSDYIARMRLARPKQPYILKYKIIIFLKIMIKYAHWILYVEVKK